MALYILYPMHVSHFVIAMWSMLKIDVPFKMRVEPWFLEITWSLLSEGAVL